MFQKHLAVLKIVVGLLVAFATPAMAGGKLNNKATATVTCTSYSITVTASGLSPGQSYTISSTMTLTPLFFGSPQTITGSIPFTASSTSFSRSVTKPLSSLTTDYTLSGEATLLSGSATLDKIPITFSPASISCWPPPPPSVCLGANSTLIDDLGAAGPSNFAILSLGGQGAVVNLQLASVVGDVGVPNFGTLQEAAASSGTGDLTIGSSVKTTGIVGSYGPIIVDDSLLTQAVNDANAAAAFFAGLPSTPSVQAQFPATGKITTDLIVTGTPGLNVVNLPGFVLNNGSGSLTLTGPAGTAFVINDSGGFNLQTGNIRVGGGVGPLDVVYNLTNPKPTVSLAVPTTAVGILLAPNSTIDLAPNNTANPSDRATLTGEVIGGFGTTIAALYGMQVKNPCGSVSDDFNRTDGPVGPNWQNIAERDMTISGNELAVAVAPSTAPAYASGYWTTNSFTTNHYSQARIPADTGSGNHQLLVRASGDSTTNRQYYQVVWDSYGNIQVGFYANNSTYPGGFYRPLNGLPVYQAKHVGDILRLEIVGSTLNVYVNGLLLRSISDGELTSGSPGILVYEGAKFDNWSGGNLP